MRALLLPFILLLTGCTEGKFDLEFPWALAASLSTAAVLAVISARRRPPSLTYTRTDLLGNLPFGFRSAFAWLPQTLRVLAICALAIAVARPQYEEFDTRTVEGTDIFLVLDMSGSMAAVDLSATEIQQYQIRQRSEPPNRFSSAIETLKTFVSQRTHDRIGMVVFARDAYLQFPLTLDYSTIQTLLDRLELEAINPSQTAIGNALGLAVRGLLNSSTQSRNVILITDGKQQGGNISPVQAAELAKAQGIKLFTILVGREGTSMAPTNMVAPSGFRFYQQQDFAVDPDLLKQIAEITDGKFYRAAQPEELERDLNAILDELEKTRMEDISSVQERELFLYFVLAALSFLVVEFLLSCVVIRRFP